MRGSLSRLCESFVASLLVLACNEDSAEPMQGETGEPGSTGDASLSTSEATHGESASTG